MSISFNWEVLSVDSALGCMLVKFTVPDSPDHDTTVNISLPPQGETLAAHVKMFAPIAAWARIEQRATYLPVSPGEKGSDTVELPVLQSVSLVSGNTFKDQLKLVVQEVLEEQNVSVV